jgi:UrcA family protein
METEMNTIITNTARALTICIAGTLGFSAADASAGTISNDTSVTGVAKEVVRFPDLDLSKIEGVTRLYGRIAHAARDVCDPLITQWHPTEYRTCVDKAIANAVATVNRPLLSQYHQFRIKGDRAGLLRLAKAH